MTSTSAITVTCSDDRDETLNDDTPGRRDRKPGASHGVNLVSRPGGDGFAVLLSWRRRNCRVPHRHAPFVPPGGGARVTKPRRPTDVSRSDGRVTAEHTRRAWEEVPAVISAGEY